MFLHFILCLKSNMGAQLCRYTENGQLDCLQTAGPQSSRETKQAPRHAPEDRAEQALLEHS